MMKFTIAIVVVSLVLFSSLALAHESEKSVDVILSEILEKQNVTKISLVDCSKVTDADFEELGDAVMERMVGNHQLHEQMDLMMGGEGSQSLRLMHISMGKNWLGCGFGFQGMMGGNYGMGMMPMMMRMMGNYYPAYYSNYDTLLSSAVFGWGIAAVLFVVLLLMWTGKIKKVGK